MQHKMDNENLRNNEPTAMPSESVTMTHNNMRNENTSGGEENLPGAAFNDKESMRPPFFVEIFASYIVIVSV
jgi:hypothetical protein